MTGHCSYLDNGFCLSCDCGACEGGFLIAEWRSAQREGNATAGPKECACVQRARNRKHLRDSGLAALVERCTFESYLAESPWQRAARQKALDYLEDYRSQGFFLSGQSGSGKTHLCTAVCNEIIQKGGRLKYFQYVHDGTHLKQLLAERESYEQEIRALLEVPLLYLYLCKQNSERKRLAYVIIAAYTECEKHIVFRRSRTYKKNRHIHRSAYLPAKIKS